MLTNHGMFEKPFLWYIDQKCYTFQGKKIEEKRNDEFMFC